MRADSITYAFDHSARQFVTTRRCYEEAWLVASPGTGERYRRTVDELTAVDELVDVAVATLRELLEIEAFSSFTMKGPSVQNECLSLSLSNDELSSTVELQIRESVFEVGVSVYRVQRSQGTRVGRPVRTLDRARAIIDEVVHEEIKTLARIFGNAVSRKLRGN